MLGSMQAISFVYTYQAVSCVNIFSRLFTGVPAEHWSLPLQEQVLWPRPVDRRLSRGPLPVSAQWKRPAAGSV